MKPVEQKESFESSGIAKINGETVATASQFENLSFYIQMVSCVRDA
jgi:hypothetical protein